LFSFYFLQLQIILDMPIGTYKIRNRKAIHFLTFAVVEWFDVFTRLQYRDIVIDSLKHCQLQKGLILNAWCLMSNHLHLLASAEEENLGAVMRDSKSFTSKEIIKAIKQNDFESRKSWMLEVFMNAGRKNSRNETYQFWRQELTPIECYSPAFTMQKLEYIHNNPVVAGWVNQPYEYLYSSALSYRNHRNEGLLKVDFL